MDSDIDSHSTNSDNSTPMLNKFWSSQVSDDSLGSGSGSSGLFKVFVINNQTVFVCWLNLLKE